MSLPTLFYVEYLTRLALFVVAWISIGYWFYADSAARGSSLPIFWSIVSVFFWPLALYYLAGFRRSHERARPTTQRERLAWIFAVSSLVAVVVGMTVTPPDPFSQGVVSWLLFAALVPLAYSYRRRQVRQTVSVRNGPD
ncbi:hypothetical protein [Haloarcula amylovorans]|uniref:hypothetical protein n=1 Tax=Haloarcula amylovorans TaxID=2562280 RepID=UPI0010761487|nr:hypothetical protein [Halomicroarcula amylolytica]